MAVTIDKKLNLVVPIDHDDGKTYYVHVIPLSRQVFEQHYELIALTLDKVFTLGLMGPRTAAVALRDIAKRAGRLQEVNDNLIPEMHRGANVLVPQAGGYDIMPWDEALGKKLFTDDDAADVESALTFFTVASAMNQKKAGDLLGMTGQLWGAELSSSTPMGYANSLKTSTEAVTSALAPIPSSVVY